MSYMKLKPVWHPAYRKNQKTPVKTRVIVREVVIFKEREMKTYAEIKAEVVQEAEAEKLRAEEARREHLQRLTKKAEEAIKLGISYGKRWGVMSYDKGEPCRDLMDILEKAGYVVDHDSAECKIYINFP